MSKVVSTKQQLEKLVSIMEENPQFAKGICTKVQATKKWEQISHELNCLGPPVRTAPKWMKVWADMKSKTKKKLSQNKAEYRATGGGPNTLQSYSSMEETIIGLLEYEVGVNPPGTEFGLDLTGDHQNTVSLDVIAATTTQQSLEHFDMRDDDEANLKTAPKKVRKNKKTERLDLLVSQTNTQKAYYDEMISNIRDIKKSALKMEEYAKKMYYLQKDTLKDILELKREKLKLYRNEILQSQQDRKSKLKMKAELLELKKQILPKKYF